jgi:hypothetical protein
MQIFAMYYEYFPHVFSLLLVFLDVSPDPACLLNTGRMWSGFTERIAGRREMMIIHLYLDTHFPPGERERL